MTSSEENCSTKKRFLENQAKSIAKKINQSAYKCPHCRAWHLTSSLKTKQSLRALKYAMSVTMAPRNAKRGTCPKCGGDGIRVLPVLNLGKTGFRLARDYVIPNYFTQIDPCECAKK